MTDSSRTFEECLYIANMLSGMIYAAELYLSFTTTYLFYHDPHKSRNQKIFYISFILIILLSQTVFVATSAATGWLMWITHRDYPGGPMAWYASNSLKSWNNYAGIGSIIVTGWSAHSLSIYRCYIIWGAKISVILPPCLLFLAEISMGIMVIVSSAGTSVFGPNSAKFLVLDVALSTVLNLLLTALISTRLLMARRSLLKLNIPPPKQYTGFVAIFVESSLPFGVLGVASAVLLGMGNPVYEAVSAVFCLYDGVSPLLILYRIARGTAWSREDSEILFSTDLSITVNSTTATGDIEKSVGSERVSVL